MQLESLRSAEDLPAAQGALNWIRERLMPGRISLLSSAQDVFSELVSETESFLHGAIGEKEEVLRITQEVRESPFWSQISAKLGKLAEGIARYLADFQGIETRAEQMSEEAGKQILFLLTELRAAQSRLERYASALHLFIGEEENTCRWLEARRHRFGKGITLATAPIDVGKTLRQSLFHRFKTVVLTSATLTVGGSFEYFHNRLGLAAWEDRDRVGGFLFESPFDYNRHALLVLPNDLPPPGSPASESAYEEWLRRALFDVAKVVRGGMFILFTSYGSLNRSFQALEQPLREAGLAPLRQGEMSRAMLIHSFRRQPSSVLFATDSFWEGVDIKGEALRCVVIARLPFRVPTEPIQQARIEAITSQGGDAFNDFAIPQAVMKLKQGFGRLIRSNEDRGVVLILDSRVVTKSYGRIFLESLPPARRVVGPMPHGLGQIQNFFGREEGKWQAL
jgi:ATP-dependent DNA helicase DinG